VRLGIAIAKMSSRTLRPSSLLARAIRSRTCGDLQGEERFLKQCIAGSQRGKWLHTHEAEVADTARFYMALRGCQLGSFSEADSFLAKLGLGVRLSNEVWTRQPTSEVPDDFFVRVVDDALPLDLVKQARDRLHPGSEYWAAHRYHDEDVMFYSHAHRPGQDLHAVDQLIEAMLPLLSSVAPAVAERVTMAEWWVHQRGPDQWHGHPMHYDTHEQLLRETRGARLRHPAVSTVVYLSEASPRFGPTLVTNQMPRTSSPSSSTSNSGEELAATVEPRLGRGAFFDGSYLHGALPGQPWLADASSPERRLCLMVGFWTCPMTPLPAVGEPRPLMEVDAQSSWCKALPRCKASGSGGARPVRPWKPGLLSPVWHDVPEVLPGGRPYAGRFFLTHRGQVDEDLCL